MRNNGKRGGGAVDPGDSQSHDGDMQIYAPGRGRGAQ